MFLTGPRTADPREAAHLISPLTPLTYFSPFSLLSHSRDTCATLSLCSPFSLGMDQFSKLTRVWLSNPCACQPFRHRPVHRKSSAVSFFLFLGARTSCCFAECDFPPDLSPLRRVPCIFTSDLPALRGQESTCRVRVGAGTSPPVVRRLCVISQMNAAGACCKRKGEKSRVPADELIALKGANTNRSHLHMQKKSLQGRAEHMHAACATV